MDNIFNLPQDEVDFIRQSNLIENERSSVAMVSAIRAWEELKKIDKLNVGDIQLLHLLMMTDVNDRIAGKFRLCNVRVGSYVAPDYTLVSGLLNEHVSNINFELEDIKVWSTAIDAEQISKKLHIEFERIHPFEDGNGRVGRMLMNWFRLKTNMPILIINEGEAQLEYYKWFK